MMVTDSQGNVITLGKEIGQGGEATVYQVQGQPHRLAKLYRKHRPNYDQKLKWMIDHHPTDPSQGIGHTSFAWPQERLYRNGTLVGYLMPFIQNTVPVLDVYNPHRRAKCLPEFNWKYLHRAASNLAAAVRAIHDCGYVIGDLNESNILVTKTALITIIDTDSFQVREHGNIHFCLVGKPEYTPPELQGMRLDDRVRTSEHDCFGLAVLIFQIIMDGSHPFRSKWLGSGDPPSFEAKISKGWFPHAVPPPYSLKPPPDVSLDILYPDIANLFHQCFVHGHHDPHQRPTANDWDEALKKAEQKLMQCPNGHFYSGHLHFCPQCPRVIRTPQLPLPYTRPLQPSHGSFPQIQSDVWDYWRSRDWQWWFWWILATTLGWVLGIWCANWLLNLIVGWPIVGVIYDRLYTAVGSTTYHTISGAISGVSVSVAQWFLLRTHLSQPGKWIPVTTVGWAIGWAIGGIIAPAALYRMTIGAVGGTVVGGLQMQVLRQQHIQKAHWWMVVSIASWTIGWAVDNMLLFKWIGGLVVGLITGFAMLWLLHIES